MVESITKPPRIELAPGLSVPRLLMGLWQVADMERDGRTLDPERSAEALSQYVEAGFDTFDMADHYGSAEIIVGRLLARSTACSADRSTDRSGDHSTDDFASVRAFTKWCPSPGAMDAATVRAGIDRSLQRLGVSRIDLLQLHWWHYAHPGYIDALFELVKLREQGLIGHLGLTNFDTDHLRLLLRQGIPIATNQVSFSLLDRRAAGRLSQLCKESGVRLLAYGALAGGFLSDRWVGAAEPADIGDWSKSKYQRFIGAIGGWAVLQDILQAARRVADKHRVSVANVAVRWVLEHDAVGAVIVGARPGEREHRDDNRAVFSFALDSQDLAWLDAALANATPLPGDCGDEYRRAPFLTASGDLSHHLETIEPVYAVRAATDGEGQRSLVDSGSQWESMAGYSRALRDGDRIVVSGTTATHGAGTVICPGDAEGQTVFILDKIKASIEALGGRLADVIRTRIYVRDANQWQGVAQVHGRYFGDIRPVNTMIGGAVLIGDYEVEIEAEAVTRSTRCRLRPNLDS
jgi:aryl-alcohol dehydrogenase-like predicted oxidoreductase/enamine deaminase RidA (YjgF/YER057c/UK114 family)